MSTDGALWTSGWQALSHAFRWLCGRVRLHELVGRRFRAGGVECLGVELREPSSVTGVSPARQNFCQRGVDIGGQPPLYG